MLADANVHVRTDALAAVLAALADVMTLDMHTWTGIRCSTSRLAGISARAALRHDKILDSQSKSLSASPLG